MYILEKKTMMGKTKGFLLLVSTSKERLFYTGCTLIMWVKNCPQFVCWKVSWFGNKLSLKQLILEGDKQKLLEGQFKGLEAEQRTPIHLKMWLTTWLRTRWYGWMMGKPRGVTHSTVWPHLDMSLALSVNQSCNTEVKWTYPTLHFKRHTDICISTASTNDLCIKVCCSASKVANNCCRFAEVQGWNLWSC